MRNGDYIPTRMEAQHDAANLLCGAKTQSNPESTVGMSVRGVFDVGVGGVFIVEEERLLPPINNVFSRSTSKYEFAIRAGL